MNKCIVLLGAMLLASVAYAGTWTELGDAPDSLPGQACVGSGTLDRIDGVMSDINDADLYGIYISDYANFRASTVGLSGVDTRLYLFDPATGNGITMNDDDPGGAGLQSTITGVFLTSNGEYVLGISSYNNMPQNPSFLDIWAAQPYTVERAPDGPGAPGPLAGWSFGGFDSGSYGIALRGAEYIPEPATLGLLALGGLALLRRR